MDKPVHDRLFKHTFGNPEHARGELRALVPAAISEQVDWSTLQLEPTDKVDEVLDESVSDLLYSVQINGESALLFLLFEHQSKEQPLMAFRLLRYETSPPFAFSSMISRMPQRRRFVAGNTLPRWPSSPRPR
jgi:predicted transposase/invertase (TIGR01784 family)